MWVDIAKSKRFLRDWRARLKYLGLRKTAKLHVLGDGASWIGKSAQRALTGCHQTLDVYHACEHRADAGKRLFGENSLAAAAFFTRGRELLVLEGWLGACRLVGEQDAVSDTPSVRQVLEKLTRYLLAYRHRLDDAACLSHGQAIGSGVVEGAAKTLGLRLNRVGLGGTNKTFARWRLWSASATARNGLDS